MGRAANAVRALDLCLCAGAGCSPKKSHGKEAWATQACGMVDIRGVYAERLGESLEVSQAGLLQAEKPAKATIRVDSMLQTQVHKDDSEWTDFISPDLCNATRLTEGTTRKDCSAAANAKRAGVAEACYKN